jgi:hypothetical protein
MTTHPEMASGRWRSFTLAEQMANVGSEVHRARASCGAAPDRVKRTECERRFRDAMERALELLSYSIDQPYASGTRKELCRLYEALASLYDGSNPYGMTIEDAERYFDGFAHAAALRKGR